MIDRFKKLPFSRSCGVASVVVMVAAGSFAFVGTSHEHPERQPTKQELLGMIHSHHHPKGMTQKIRGDLTVNIQSPSEFAANQPLVYIAEIHTDAPLSEASYKWLLPPGLELIQGQTEGELRDLTPGQPISLEITAQSVLDENLQLHFKVASTNEDFRFSATAQYNTKNQPLIDDKIKALHEKTKMAVQKGTRQ